MFPRIPVKGEEVPGSTGSEHGHHEFMSLRVLIADDHPVVRGGLRALIETLDGLEVVGEAADGETTVREAQLLRPDVVLMDVRMPGLDGVEATRRIRAGVPGDGRAHADHVRRRRDRLHRDAGRSPWLPAQGRRTGGDRRGHPRGRRRAGDLRPGRGGTRTGLLHGATHTKADPFPELTEREREILDLLASGRRTTAIAEALFLSPKTVSNHLTSIFAKLEVADRTAAIIRAREGGLGT